ncbi:hypothetical protein HNQ91_001970 [Filimonas zeae]|uniref:Uncharacterized protein n=1 Tax=Filimonas zeae TaxID=1737353 RepID=A0A917IWJ6_9BACT|nr:hypothetical protein [Filimonas zeae]MDR6338919.1 hypothetical protein [Filimonas zeae]GGH65966.1 hypothetical protein GCM10011379_19640 [Filimonas zeae]
MNKMNKLLRCVPYVLVGIIHLFAWVQILAGANEPGLRHYLALLLLAINGVLYFKKHQQALILTALILVLSSLNLIELYTYTGWYSWFVRLGGWEVSLPGLQWKSVGLLLLYALMTGRYWVNKYMDKKYGKLETSEQDVNGTSL